MNTYEDVVKACNAKIPRDVIQTRDGGSGRKLDYLAGFYVIDRLNEVFGQGNWAYTSDVLLLHSGTVETRSGPTHSVHYSAKVRLALSIGDKPTEFTDYGYGDGTDKNNPGKAHELAIKEAVTDGLKRAARCLGSSFGNALYDRSGEGIDEGKGVGKQESPQTSSEPSVSEKVQSSRATINKSIAAASKVIVDKKIATLEDLQKKLKDMGVSRKEDLTDGQAQIFLKDLKGMLK